MEGYLWGNSARQARGWLIGLVLLGLLLRLGWSLSRPVDAASLAGLPDQVEYLEAGRHLLQGEGLWFFDQRFEQKVYAARTVGYPLLIAVCGGSVRAVQFVQAGIDVSTALAVYLIARKWLGWRRSVAASALTMFNPLLVYFSALLLTETLYVAMLAWSVWLMTDRRRVWWGLGLCALSVHVRPAGALFPWALGAVSAWTHGATPRWKHAVLQAGAGAAATVLVLLPWAMRNEHVLGDQVWLTTNGGITAYDGIHPGATGASDQSFVKQMPELAGLGERERDQYLTRLAREAFWRDPARAATLAVRKIARTWSPVPLSEQFGSRLYVMVGLTYTLPLLLLAAMGVFLSRLPLGPRIMLLMPALLITLAQAATVGSLRYRLPAEPMLSILAVSIACHRNTWHGASALKK